MTYDEASKIVNDFADVLSVYFPMIPDSRLLPHGKATIRAAFRCCVGEYEVLRDTAPTKFTSDHADYLALLKGLIWRLSQFQDIDPEDRDAVDFANGSSRWHEIPGRVAARRETEYEKAHLVESMKLFAKYHRRAVEEDARERALAGKHN